MLLSPTTQALLSSQGYVPRDGSPADLECERLLRLHMATHHPTLEQVRSRLDEALARPEAPGPHVGGLDGGTEVYGWIDPWAVFSEPWRYTRDDIAQWAHEHARDPRRIVADSQDLWVTYLALPWPGMFTGTVTTNGNHRLAVAQALGLPLIPAHLALPGDEWDVEFDLGPALDVLQAHGLLTVPRSEFGMLRVSDPDRWGRWLMPPRRDSTLSDRTLRNWAVPRDPDGVPDQARSLEQFAARPLPQEVWAAIDAIPTYTSPRVPRSKIPRPVARKRRWWQL